MDYIKRENANFFPKRKDDIVCSKWTEKYTQRSMEYIFFMVKSVIVALHNEKNFFDEKFL